MRLLTKDGKTQKVADWAKELGLNKNTIHRRIARGCTHEQALMECPTNTVFLTVNGKTKKAVEWAEKYGLNPKTIIERMKNGFTPEECLQKPKPKVLMLTHNGETLSVKDWAKRSSVTHHAFFMRVRKLGWPMEKALTTPPRVHEEPERMEIGGRAQPGQRFSFSL